VIFAQHPKTTNNQDSTHTYTNICTHAFTFYKSHLPDDAPSLHQRRPDNPETTPVCRAPTLLLPPPLHRQQMVRTIAPLHRLPMVRPFGAILCMYFAADVMDICQSLDDLSYEFVGVKDYSVKILAFGAQNITKEQH